MAVPKRFIAMLGALSALAPLSIDASLPALPLMARDLHAADWLMQATLGAFMLAFALGRLQERPSTTRFALLRVTAGS